MKKKPRKFKMKIEYDFEKNELKTDLGKEEWMIPQILGIMNDVNRYLINRWHEKEFDYEQSKKEESKNGRK